MLHDRQRTDSVQVGVTFVIEIEYLYDNLCVRFQQIESRWGYSGTSDKIRFIVDRRIFVVGFGLYGSIHGPSEYDVTIQVTIVN